MYTLYFNIINAVAVSLGQSTISIPTNVDSLNAL